MSKTVALDIGHGSNTFPPSKGVYKNGKGYAEHDFNSKLVQAIDKILKSNGIKTIIYQKPFSKDIPLTTRTNYYNAQKVDLVYSIHANYNADPNANGRCVFYWHTSKQSKKMADIVVDEIKKAGYSTHGNGLHASIPNTWTNLHICRVTNMPAVLVENGFMSGNKDFDLVFGNKQAEYIKDMAQVHANAIGRFFGVKVSDKPASKPEPSKPSAPKPKPGKQRGVATVTVPTLSLRNSPSTKGKLIRKLSKGEAYKVWEEKNGWLRLGKDMWASWQNGAYMNWTEKPTSKPEPSKPKANLTVDGKWGKDVTRALQRYYDTPQDGIISKQLKNSVSQSLYSNTVQFGTGGSLVIKKLQKDVGSKADGYLGTDTVRKLQQKLKMKHVDGVLSKPSLVVKELQKRLNKGKL